MSAGVYLSSDLSRPPPWRLQKGVTAIPAFIARFAGGQETAVNWNIRNRFFVIDRLARTLFLRRDTGISARQGYKGPNP